MADETEQEHVLVCQEESANRASGGAPKQYTPMIGNTMVGNQKSYQGYDLLEEDIWIADSGATSHMTNDNTGLYDVEAYNSSVSIGNGKSIGITHKGKLDVMIEQKDGTKYAATLENVKLVPELGHSLFSTQTLMMKGWQFSSEHADNPIKQVPKMVLEGTRDLKFDRVMKAGPSVLTGLKLVRQIHTANLATQKGTKMTRTQWHAVLGHCG